TPNGCAPTHQDWRLFMDLLHPIPATSRQPSPRRRRGPRRRISLEVLEARELLAGGLDVGMNITGVSYAGSAVFLDVMKMSKPTWNVTNALTAGLPWNISDVALPP